MEEGVVVLDMQEGGGVPLTLMQNGFYTQNPRH
jgi:hypothetical protein